MYTELLNIKKCKTLIEKKQTAKTGILSLPGKKYKSLLKHEKTFDWHVCPVFWARIHRVTCFVGRPVESTQHAPRGRRQPTETASADTFRPSRPALAVYPGGARSRSWKSRPQ